LALIAYRQPITRGEIEDIRGVSVSSSIMKTLQERDWIRVVGHRDVPGKPAMYASTRGFLDYFNLKSLDELPTLAELRDIDSINAELDLGDVPPGGNAEAEEDDDGGVQASAAVAGDDAEPAGEVADDAVPDEIADEAEDAAEGEIGTDVEEDSEPTAASEQDAVADAQDDDEDSDAGERLSENG